MKKYVCEMCRGNGWVWSCDMEGKDDCSLCVKKGYTPFIMAREPNDEAIVQAIKPEPVKEEVVNASPEQVVSGSSQV